MLRRWSNEIPDEWFVKTASPTGQQTFFPRRLICERVELIQSTKDDLGLSSLAAGFAGEEKNEEYLVVATDFGEQKFKLNEVINVKVISAHETKVMLWRRKK